MSFKDIFKLSKQSQLLLFVFLVLFSVDIEAQKYPYKLDVSEQYALSKVNALRAKGCKCGSKKYKPAQALRWDSTLEQTAFNHAKHMLKYNIFSHHSIDGKDIGDRLDQAGYNWQYAGENLAEGQKSFDEAMRDWIKSPTHCKMLMNPDMKEIGIARFGKFWVQHFGAKMPPKTRRTKVRYREG